MFKFGKTYSVFASGATVACVLSVAGCTLPGSQMDVVAQRSVAETGSGMQTDVFAINPQTIKRLADEDAELRSKQIASIDRPQPTIQPYGYVIGPQDVLRVTVWDHPELNNPGAITGTSSLPPSTFASGTTPIAASSASTDGASRTVGDDGTMFYPYVGLINVAGKTTNQVRDFLAKALSKTIRAPQVEVVVATYRSQRVYVTGEVKTPGSVQVSDIPLRIADVVTSAGGLTSNADLDDATLIRGTKVYPIDLYSMLYKGDLSSNFRLEDGDILNVPEARFRKIFVLGEVQKASSVLMPRGKYTLTEALGDAGGASQLTAKTSQIYVIRSIGDRVGVFQLDAAQPDALILADLFELHARDVVFVDATGSARIGRIISQVLPVAQLLQAGRYSATGY